MTYPVRSIVCTGCLAATLLATTFAAPAATLSPGQPIPAAPGASRVTFSATGDAVYNASIAAPANLPPLSDAKPLKLPEVFPIPMTFWSFMRLPPDQFAKRLEEQAPYPVVHGVGPTKLEGLEWIVKQRWPDKIVIRQDAYGGGIGSENVAQVWPGHFLYKVGTKLTKDCSPTDTTIWVEKTNAIQRNPRELTARAFPLTFTLYALDERGKPDWSRAEMLTLTKVENGALIAKRAAWGGKPLAFKAGKAVAATNMMFWTRQFQINLSLDCPRGGPDNLTGAEWLARQKADRLLKRGADGIEFDVGRWTWGQPGNNPLDCNNDLVPDYGYLNGVSTFGLGGRVFFRELRRILGPNKIIQVDSNNPGSLRGWDYLNGVQMESFPAENHFEQFSEAFMHLRRWSQEARALPRFSYGFTKTPTTVFSNARLPDGSPTDFRFRVGFAAACLVGMPHPFAGLSTTDFDPDDNVAKNEEVEFQTSVFAWDEYHGGDLNNWQWLGKPLGPATQYLDDLAQEDLLAGATWQWKTDQRFEAACELADAGAAATVKRIPEQTFPSALWFGVRLEPQFKQPLVFAPGKDYTLEFETRGDDKWEYAGQTFENVPRCVYLRGIAAGEQSATVNAENEWYTCRLSLVADAKAEPGLAFGVSEQIGCTELRNIRLRAGGCERWRRDFAGGAVLLNMTKRPWKLDIGDGYRRLKGKQCPEVNTGETVHGEIVVPAWDAVFLARAKN